MKSTLLGFACAAAFMFCIDRYAFESVLVPSSSMEPTLLPRDRGILQKVFTGEYHRFDVVVINSRALHERLVKRIIGLPGECIRLEDSWRVVINERTLDYRSLQKDPAIQLEAEFHPVQLKVNPEIHFDTTYGLKPLCLGPNEYYLLGDNRLASGDSRYFGPVSRSEIEGKLKLIYYSYDRTAHQIRWERVLSRVR